MRFLRTVGLPFCLFMHSAFALAYGQAATAMAAQGAASAAERAGRIFYDGRTPDGNASSTDLGRARTYLAQAGKAGSASARALLERIDASIVPADDAGYVPPPYGC